MYSQCNLPLIKKLFLDLARFSGGISKILYSLVSAPGTTISFGHCDGDQKGNLSANSGVPL
jgi:hypothetical protein